MGLDLVIWPDEEGLTAEGALNRYQELVSAPAASTSSPSIQSFLTELDERWPPLKSDPDNSSPWSGSRSVGDQHVRLDTVLNHRNLLGLLNDVFDLAARHGLAVFDPQSLEYIRPDGSSSRVPQADAPTLDEEAMSDELPEALKEEFEAEFQKLLSRSPKT